jgi:hypothetical protein
MYGFVITEFSISSAGDCAGLALRYESVSLFACLIFFSISSCFVKLRERARR